MCFDSGGASGPGRSTDENMPCIPPPPPSTPTTWTTYHVVKGDPRKHELHEELDYGEHREDDPVRQPLLVVALLRALDRLETAIPRIDDAGREAHGFHDRGAHLCGALVGTLAEVWADNSNSK